jgi:cytosine/adenosine deaminase-related metal-dependent hydrolase
MIVQGAILDRDGARPGYVRIRAGHPLEVGSIGCDSTRGRERRIRGIVVPPMVNGHTHLADFLSVREPPKGSLADLVRPPDGYKFRLLKGASSDAKRRAMHAALRWMERQGIGATIDFREEGIGGVRLLRDAAHGSSVQPVILGRPPAGDAMPTGTVDQLVRIADGIGISSAREVSRERRRMFARACRRSGKLFALHASESVREDPDDYLDPPPDLVVHLTRATPEDLIQVHSAHVFVTVCPRSNALFGRWPPLDVMERLDLPVLLGTDNGMLRPPTLFREAEFAYVASRLRQRPVSARFIARSLFVTPWELLGTPDRARIVDGSEYRPQVLRLPPDDPEYQIVTRACEQFIVRPESPASTGAAR